jgi:putative ABC transport system permease protein
MKAATASLEDPPRRAGPGLPLALRLAARQMRSGFEGFSIFMLCVALGVMVIAALGGFADALIKGLERQGREIIGGDIAISRMHARATTEERRAMEGVGSVSESATLRVMARTTDGEEQMLAEVKSVDAAYPLVGEIVLEAGHSFEDALSEGAVVEPILLERLGLRVGDPFNVGSATLKISGIIKKEPDGLLDRLTYGPRVLVSGDQLTRTGLVTPAALIRWRYAIRLASHPDSSDQAELDAARSELASRLSTGGFTVVDRSDPSPQVRRTIERLHQFLTLIGLTALIVGGVGIANAVANFVDRRRRTIATMRSLGGRSQTIFSVFLVQILFFTAAGICIGLAAGLAIPVVLSAVYAGALPITPVLAISPASLLAASGYGLLVALLFSLWPLGRMEFITSSVLFRDQVGKIDKRPRLPIVAATAALAASLAGVAILSSETPLIAAYFAGVLALTLAIFQGLGIFVTWVARRIPRPGIPELAIALGSIAAPGGLSRTIVLSLGTGLSMLVAVALTDASLEEELSGKMPEAAPDYFMLDIPRGELAAFKSLVEKRMPKADIKEAPMLRGRLVELGGRKAEDIKAPPEAEWVLRGDRGITYASELPPGSRLVEGDWWTSSYSGPPLVSFEADLARMLGVRIGDMVVVNVLGRDISARIANLRHVDWDSLSLNFVMVFSPNTLASAPFNYLATIRMPESLPLSAQADLLRAITKTYPGITSIGVREAVDAFNRVFSRIMTAVRTAGWVTLVAGALVLAGALATAQRRRLEEAVILKALGATRNRILAAHLLEHLILAAVTAVFAILIGGLAAWIALVQFIEVPFKFSWPAILEALGIAIGLVVVLGGIGTWQVLNARPVRYLRSE